MAKPTRLPSGNWRIQWIDTLGKRRSAAFATEAAAKSALRRKLVEKDDIRSGRARERSDQTLTDAANEWLLSRPEKRRKDDAPRLEQHILPFMGDKRLTEVPLLVQKFIRHLEKKKTSRKGEKNAKGRTLKPNTIKNILITLRKMMNDLDYPIRFKFKVATETYNWLRTPTDVAKFLDACGDNWFRMAAQLAVYAGLRKGEIAGLVWSAIDFPRSMLKVDRSYAGPTKSKQTRWVPLSPELASALQRWRMAYGGRLVVTRDGAPITPDTEMAKRARRVCRRAAVPEVKFHELRDTYASHLAERVSLPIVGAVLGHVDPKTTARYAHIDTASLARDPRLHLSFTNSKAKVIPLNQGCTRSAHGAKSKKRKAS